MNEWMQSWLKTHAPEDVTPGFGVFLARKPEGNVAPKPPKKRVVPSRRSVKAAALTPEAWVKRALYAAFSDAKKRATKARQPFTLSIEDALKHFEKLGPRCALTGIEFRRVDGVFRQPFRPSFDRVDSSKPYSPENTRIVACCVNAAMNEWGSWVLDLVAETRAARLATGDRRSRSLAEL